MASFRLTMTPPKGSNSIPHAVYFDGDDTEDLSEARGHATRTYPAHTQTLEIWDEGKDDWVAFGGQ